MLISYSHKFIFFHISKVAGISIREALKDYVQEPEKFKIKRPPKMVGEKPNPLYERWLGSILHAKAREAKKELPEEVYNNFYKFAFVRNPWDWQVSMYHFLLKKTEETKYNFVREMAGFDEYLEWVIKTENPYPKGTPKLQKDLITDSEGKIIVDFVGRYETLSQDFDYVCKILNLKACLPHLNKTLHQDYKTYYSERTIKKVEEHFKEDIKLFGYTFDGYSPGVRQEGQIPGNALTH